MLRGLVWHGWLPGLSTAGERDPWAASLGQLADKSVELALGAYPIGDHPCVWRDGSLESSGFSVAGAGMYFPAPELAMQSATWEGRAEGWLRNRCPAFMQVPGRLQTVQRAEFLGARFWPCRPFGLVTEVWITLVWSGLHRCTGQDCAFSRRVEASDSAQ